MILEPVFHVVFCILLLVFYMLTVANKLPRGYRLLVIVWFLFGEVSSSSGCLGCAALFYCGTPCAFSIIMSVFEALALFNCSSDGYILETIPSK